VLAGRCAVDPPDLDVLELDGRPLCGRGPLAVHPVDEPRDGDKPAVGGRFGLDLPVGVVDRRRDGHGNCRAGAVLIDTSALNQAAALCTERARRTILPYAT